MGGGHACCAVFGGKSDYLCPCLWHPGDYRIPAVCFEHGPEVNEVLSSDLYFQFPSLDSLWSFGQILRKSVHSCDPGNRDFDLHLRPGQKDSKIEKAIDKKHLRWYNSYNNQFKEALSDNLNTSNAITTLYDVLKADINNSTKLSLIESFDKVLSLNLIKQQEEIDEDLLKYINECIEKRKEAKLNKDYNLADTIRKELEEKGIILKDTREGTTFEVIK